MQADFASFSWADVLLLLVRLLGAVTLVWLIPAGLTRLFARQWSAALRYRLWSMSTVAVLMLPALILLLPDWRVAHVSRANGAPLQPSIAESKVEPTQAPATLSNRPAIHVSSAKPVAKAQQHPAPEDDFPWAACIAVVWLVVCGWMLVRQLIAIAWAARMLSRARLILKDESAAAKLRQLSGELNRRSTPRLKTSDEIPSPMCVGLFRSSIVLPADFASWPDAQLDAVLAHELAHAIRRDVLWQAAARLACAIYWFHPLAWFAARQMHAERELACDDSVLRSGQESTQYARLLVQLAEVIAALPKPAELAGVGMAGRHRLQQRVHALLEPTRRRNSVSRLAAILLSTVGGAVVVVAAMLDPLGTPNVRADESTTQPAAVLTPDVEKLLNDLAAQEAMLQNLTIRAQSWDEVSPTDGKNDWQKDKTYSIVQAWYAGSPLQKGRFDVHDEVRRWINGATPFSRQSYVAAFDGKTGKYIQIATGPLGQVHDIHTAMISATMPGGLSSQDNDTGRSFTIYGIARNGKGASAFFREYFGTIRARDPEIPIIVTAEKFQGADTLRLTIGALAKATESFWFDKTHGLALLGVRTAGHDHDGREICSLELHVNKLAEIGPKIWFPMEFDRYLGNWYPDPVDTTVGKPRAGDTDSIRHRSRFVATECKANDPKFDAGIFSPEVPEGFAVTDQAAKTSYTATKPKKVDPALEQMLREKIGS